MWKNIEEADGEVHTYDHIHTLVHRDEELIGEIWDERRTFQLIEKMDDDGLLDLMGRIGEELRRRARARADAPDLAWAADSQPEVSVGERIRREQDVAGEESQVEP